MYTVEIDVSRAWLSDPANPTGPIVACGTLEQDSVFTMDGDLRIYAGPVVEMATRTQDTRTKQLTMRHLSPAQAEQVRSWRGRQLLLRTADGDRMFCAYLEIDRTRLLRTTPDDGTPGSTTYDLQITFQQVSFDETQLPAG
jgi:hypothetical protein